MFKSALPKQLEAIRDEIAALRSERRALANEAELQGNVNTLKAQIADLGIQKSKLTEDHEREKRETLHMVGLERKRQEFEIESAKRETTLAVREENLAADKQRFADQMEFQGKRFEEEVGYLKDLMGQVLGRLPTVNVEKTVKG